MDDDSISDINENFGIVSYIMLARIYDMLALIADGVGKGEDALRLISLHQSGELMAPPPSIVMDGSENGDESDEQTQSEDK